MEKIDSQVNLPPGQEQFLKGISLLTCLLYTSDAADE